MEKGFVRLNLNIGTKYPTLTQINDDPPPYVIKNDKGNYSQYDKKNHTVLKSMAKLSLLEGHGVFFFTYAEDV